MCINIYVIDVFMRTSENTGVEDKDTQYTRIWVVDRESIELVYAVREPNFVPRTHPQMTSFAECSRSICISQDGCRITKKVFSVLAGGM